MDEDKRLVRAIKAIYKECSVKGQYDTYSGAVVRIQERVEKVCKQEGIKLK